MPERLPPRTRRRAVAATLAAAGVVVVAAAIGAPYVAQAATTPAVATAAPHLVGGDTPDGYAAGTTGGQGGSTRTVTTASAFTSAVSGNNAKTVQVQGMIKLSAVVFIGSNTTIIGVGASSGFTGSGLEVRSNHNVIIRNLTVSYAVGVAAIRVWGSNHVWINHDTLITDRNHGPDYYDGLVNITKGSDDVTVSWSVLEQDYETSLIGASDSDGSLDKGHENVTFHHNYFLDCTERTPSIRFGHAHVYNNYFNNVTNGIHSRMGAQVLVQNNVFRNSGVALTTTGSSSQDGYATVPAGNDFGGATVTITQKGTFTTPPYTYRLDPTSSVIGAVAGSAGAGH